MKFNHIIYSLFTVLGMFLSSCMAQRNEKVNETYSLAGKKSESSSEISNVKIRLPEIQREFRAAWIATVANINWPSKNNLSVEEQKKEAIAVLDKLKDANFNAVIFQARPSADALYKSNLEPWSYFLTGELGKEPSPYYDPLEFWIDESHKRGMVFHVWINPYRAHHTTGGAVSSKSMVKKFSKATYKLRNGMHWMDPSDTKVQDHVSSVIRDIVKRYDIDAIHIDDYFYPYKEYHGGKDFPDNTTWNSYIKSGGNLSKSDWRRANVNKFIKRIHDEIKQIKSYVKFGISPFGIWKPGFPNGIKGSSQYDELYADAKLWLNQGWCDYYSPQLYWKDGGDQSFSSLLDWWKTENTKNIHLWPGVNTVGVRNVSDRPKEIEKQIQITRSKLPNSKGVIHYSVAGVTKNVSMFSTLKNVYKEKTIVPESPWIKVDDISKPKLSLDKKSRTNIEVNWSIKGNEAFLWVLYLQYGDEWTYEIYENSKSSTVVSTQKGSKMLKGIALKAIDRLGNESHFDFQYVK